MSPSSSCLFPKLSAIIPSDPTPGCECVYMLSSCVDYSLKHSYQVSELYTDLPVTVIWGRLIFHSYYSFVVDHDGYQRVNFAVK